jgi:N-dimethylarginine dimethylaminohydrolase
MKIPLASGVLPLALTVAIAAPGIPPQPLDRCSRTTAGDQGAIEAWILHFDPRIADCYLPTIRDLIAAVPRGVRIRVAVASPVDALTFADRMDSIRATSVRLGYLVTDRPVSAWARDRYLLFSREGRATALIPAPDTVPEDKRGDLAVARILAEDDPGLQVISSTLDLEGGDVLFAGNRALVGASTILNNAGRFGGDAEAAAEAIERALGRELVIVGETDEDLPHEHLDMFLTVVGPGRLMLGDPRLADGYFEVPFHATSAEGDSRVVGIFGRQTQREWVPVYDRLATQLRREGFRIDRVPILHADDGMILTWNNAVVERRREGAIAYVPRYGVPTLDRLAHGRWRALGFVVRPIRCAGIIAHGGALRCLTAVLRATPSGRGSICVARHN